MDKYDFECPKCGTWYYSISYDSSLINEGILIVKCECDSIECDYSKEYTFELQKPKAISERSGHVPPQYQKLIDEAIKRERINRNSEILGLGSQMSDYAVNEANRSR